MTRQTLIEDAERMERAACELAFAKRIGLASIVYWCCVAVLHLIEWTVGHDKGESHAADRD